MALDPQIVSTKADDPAADRHEVPYRKQGSFSCSGRSAAPADGRLRPQYLVDRGRVRGVGALWPPLALRAAGLGGDRGHRLPGHGGEAPLEGGATAGELGRNALLNLQIAPAIALCGLNLVDGCRYVFALQEPCSGSGLKPYQP